LLLLLLLLLLNLILHSAMQRNIARSDRPSTPSSSSITTSTSTTSSSSLPSSSSGKHHSAAPKDEPKVTMAQLETRTSNLLEEYFSLDDLEEAVECVKEMKIPKELYAHFVNKSVTDALEAKDKERTMVGRLLIKLNQLKIVSIVALIDGYGKDNSNNKQQTTLLLLLLLLLLMKY
jgi:hypothetical protein